MLNKIPAWIKLVCKLLIVGGCFYWLFSKDLLNLESFTSLRLSFTDSYLVGLYLIYIALVALRFRFLISSFHDYHFPLTYMAQVSWVSLFFSTILPGSVTGDIMKFSYLKGASKKVIGLSILLDRFVGMVSLIYMSNIATLYLFFFEKEVFNLYPKLFYFIFLLGVGFVVGNIVYIALKINAQVQGKLSKIPMVSQLLQVEIMNKSFHFSVMCSFTAQCILVFIFYRLGLIISGPEADLSFFSFLILVPLGLIVTAIPVAPLGIGVGHVAFSYLFKRIGIANGAELFNFFICFAGLMNVMGAFPYLLLKKNQVPQENLAVKKAG